jgi:uncharacterized protein (DUF2062 family)
MKFKDFKQRFLDLKGDPSHIAKGVALGTFIGMTPFPGFRMVIAIAIARLIHVHKTAAAVSVYSNNALTGLPIMALNYWLGMKVLALQGMPDFPMTSLREASSFIFHSGLNVFLSVSVGGIILGIPFAALMYFLSYKYFTKQSDRHLNRNHDRLVVKSLDLKKAS